MNAVAVVRESLDKSGENRLGSAQREMRHRELATEKRCSHPNEMRDDIEVIGHVSKLIACVASVSVRFRSKERPRNGILSFDRARNETRVKK